jgi:hypothetical protein
MMAFAHICWLACVVAESPAWKTSDVCTTDAWRLARWRQIGAERVNEASTFNRTSDRLFSNLRSDLSRWWLLAGPAMRVAEPSARKTSAVCTAPLGKSPCGAKPSPSE